MMFNMLLCTYCITIIRLSCLSVALKKSKSTQVLMSGLTCTSTLFWHSRVTHIHVHMQYMYMYLYFEYTTLYYTLVLYAITYKCKGNSHITMITVQSSTIVLRSTVDYHLIKV